ncbi:MAG: hypothetical protein ABIR02_08235 [Novosphingobium sp.]
MLSTPAPFPNPGAHAFLRPVGDLTAAQPCRIIQRRGDGRLTVSLTGREFSAGNSDIRARASGTRTVELADVVATAEEAVPPAASKAVAAAKPKRAKVSRQPRRSAAS